MEYRKEIFKRGRPPTPPSTKREEFTKLSTTLNSQLHNMYIFLRRVRPRYVQSIHFEPTLSTRTHPLTSTHPNDVTPKEREAFDDTMIAFLRRAKRQLKNMELVATQDQAQNKIHQYHRKQVAQDLTQQLQELATEYDEMVKRAASETMRVSLTLDMAFVDTAPSDDNGTLIGTLRRRTRRRWPSTKSYSLENVETKGVTDTGGWNESSVEASELKRSEQQQQEEEEGEHQQRPAVQPIVQPAETKENQDQAATLHTAADLSESHLQQESAMLERSLNTRLDATQQLETQFVELANMTKMFTTHVEDQHDQVQTIHEDTQDALDYADSGLKELQKASTGTSKYFLTVIFLLLSFIVLFLDWWSY